MTVPVATATREPLRAMTNLACPGWLVGGAVRDRLVGRRTGDFDLAVAGDPRAVARTLARTTRAHAFKLSDGFGAWRVVAHDKSWQIDLMPLNGRTIEADLGERDLTINAIAEPLGGGELVDPFGGSADLRAGRLRMVSREAFKADALRTLRLARLACELGFEVDPETASVARASAPALARVAPERVFAELKRIVVSERVLDGVELADSLGAIAAVLPEVDGLKGIAQSRYHHLDVYEHTLSVLAETVALQRDPAGVFGEQADAVCAVLDEPLANELTRGQALRFGALLHDIAKPQTRSYTPEGRVTFVGHDSLGAQLAGDILRRLRASERLAEHVAALARHHLRLGFLVHELPLSRRTVYHYLHACTPVEVDVTVLSVADRLATRGSGATEAIAKHLRLARELLAEALVWRADPPRPPVRGDELADALGLDPGPRLGWLLDELTVASFAGEIDTQEQALDRARETLSRLHG